MGLNTEPPYWMIQAIPNRQLRVRLAVRAVHGLEEEMLERKRFVLRGITTRLGKNQLEFVAGVLAEPRSRLGAYTNPIQPRRGNDSSVGLHGDLKTAFVQLPD